MKILSSYCRKKKNKREKENKYIADYERIVTVSVAGSWIYRWKTYGSHEPYELVIARTTLPSFL